MNLLSRVILFIKRNLLTNLLLLIIILASITIIELTYTLSKNMTEINEELFNKFGVKYSIRVDTDEISNTAYFQDPVVNQEIETFKTNYTSFMRELMNLPEVQYGNYGYHIYAYDSDRNMINEYYSRYASEINPINQQFILYGTYSLDLFEMENNLLSLVEGRTFTEEEMSTSAMVCIVEEGLHYYIDGEIKPIEIGDIIEMNSKLFEQNNMENAIDCDNEIALEVIGKFDKVNDDTYYYGINVEIITPLETAKYFDLLNKNFVANYYDETHDEVLTWSHPGVFMNSLFCIKDFGASDAFEDKVLELAEKYNYEITFEASMTKYKNLI